MPGIKAGRIVLFDVDVTLQEAAAHSSVMRRSREENAAVRARQECHTDDGAEFVVR